MDENSGMPNFAKWLLIPFIIVMVLLTFVVPALNTASIQLTSEKVSSILTWLQNEGYVAWAVGGLSPGQVPYADSSSTLAGDSDFTYDATSNVLSVPTGRTATYIVAASDSSVSSKAQADYICDGTADNVEIQVAIDALPVTGGKVLLLEGRYDIGARIELNDINITLEGLGDNTLIYLANNSDVHMIAISAAKCVVRNLKLNGNSANQTPAVLYGILVTGPESWCEGVTVTDCKQTGIGIHAGGDRFLVESCHIDHCKYNYSTAACLNGGIFINCFSEQATDRGYYITGGVGALDVSKNISIIGCDSLDDDSGIVFNGCRYCLAEGNHIYEPAIGAGIGTWDTKDVGNRHISILNNHIYHPLSEAAIGVIGVTAAHSLFIQVEGNHIYASEAAGIHMVFCEDSIIKGNLLYDTRLEAMDISGCIRINIEANTLRDIVHTGSREAIKLLDTTYSKVEGNIAINGALWDGMDSLVEEVGTSNFNIVKNNIAKDCRVAPIILIGANSEAADFLPHSAELDLTGGATDVVIFHAAVPCQLVAYTILYTEATGGGVGVNIRVGRYKDGVALDDDYYDVSVSELNKALGYQKHFITADLTAYTLAVGDTLTVGTAGGKADTGKVIIILQIAEMVD